MQHRVLDAALSYCALGWSLLPISPNTKKPAVRSWEQYQRSSASADQVRRWFEGNPERGLAVILGNVSGDLFCRDFDELEAYNRWAASYPRLAESLPTVETSRGRHVYALAKFGKIEKRGDGELRGNGYCVLPPSVHPSGTPYKWLIRPNENIQRIDLGQAGFLSAHATERTETAEITEKTEENRGLLKQSKVIVLEADEIDDALQKAINDAISMTVPKKQGTRNRLVFELARALQAVPYLKDADPNTLKRFVQQWHTLAKPYIKTQYFDETWIDFLNGWPRVKFPLGEEPMADIFARAVDNSEFGFSYEMPKLRLLASLCRELQRSSGEGPFYLSCRKAAELIDIDHTTASRWLNHLEREKVISLVEKGSQSGNRASRYRFTKPI